MSATMTCAARAQVQTAKGPAEVAASPSHGSTHPTKDKEMNVSVDTTAPPVSTRRDATTDGAVTIKDLQDQADLVNELAAVTSFLARHLLSDTRGDGDGFCALSDLQQRTLRTMTDRAWDAAEEFVQSLRTFAEARS